MIKKSQSLLDFINMLPSQAIFVKRSLLDNKEAKTLFSIWQGDRDKYGYAIVPNDIDQIAIANLTSKGVVKNKLEMYGLSGLGGNRVVEITKKGKDIIRNIILHSEKSKFEDAGDFNYEAIHNLINAHPISKSAMKIALVHTAKNWVHKILWKLS